MYQPHNTPNNSRSPTWIKVATMTAGAWLIWYLSGPIAAECSRGIYEWVYGKPAWFNFASISNRAHFAYYAYQYAEYVVPIVLSPIFYKLPDMIQACLLGGQRDESILNEAFEDDSSEISEISEEQIQQIRNILSGTNTVVLYTTHSPNKTNCSPKKNKHFFPSTPVPSPAVSNKNSNQRIYFPAPSSLMQRKNSGRFNGYFPEIENDPAEITITNENDQRLKRSSSL